jgi:hypothetical protein
LKRKTADPAASKQAREGSKRRSNQGQGAIASSFLRHHICRCCYSLGAWKEGKRREEKKRKEKERKGKGKERTREVSVFIRVFFLSFFPVLSSMINLSILIICLFIYFLPLNSDGNIGAGAEGQLL